MYSLLKVANNHVLIVDDQESTWEKLFPNNHKTNVGVLNAICLDPQTKTATPVVVGQNKPENDCYFIIPFPNSLKWKSIKTL